MITDVIQGVGKGIDILKKIFRAKKAAKAAGKKLKLGEAIKAGFAKDKPVVATNKDAPGGYDASGIGAAADSSLFNNKDGKNMSFFEKKSTIMGAEVPTWLLYAGGALAAYVVLKKMRIIGR